MAQVLWSLKIKILIFTTSLLLIKTKLKKRYRGSKNLLKNGLLSKTTHGSILRLCPPLNINKREIDESLEIISKSIKTI